MAEEITLMMQMPFRIFYAGIVLGLSLLGGVMPVQAKLVDSVTAFRTLQQVGATLQNSSDTGVFRITFSTYKNINQFKLDAPTARIDSLIFQRNLGQESDSVITVDSTLFNIKRTKGTVVLLGLAFNLTKPNSVLIAGSESGKENLHLVIDSCFIYADSLEGTFLSWAAGNAGNIEIRRSFFVSRAGTVMTKLSLAGKRVTLQNNLFNFSGTVMPTVAVNADISHNTFNRTQLYLSGDPSLGIPTYNFSYNLIAHHSTASAIGSPNFWFAFISGLNDVSAIIANNRLYDTWKGFRLGDATPFASVGLNNILDTVMAKPPAELWDWYTLTDTLSGFPFGPSARKFVYNVLPGSVTKGYSWVLLSTLGKVFFQPAPIPRHITVSRNPDPAVSAAILANPSIRFFQPAAGPLHFGAFQVDSISVAVPANDGTPVLLARDSAGNYKPQPPKKNQLLSSNPSIFTNALTSSRKFFLGFLGNTASGINITPNWPTTEDLLIFHSVDSAGYTSMIVSPFCASCTNELRFLKRNFHFQSTAVLKDSLTFGQKDSLPAFRDDSLYWLLGTPARLVKALKTTGPSRTVYAKVPAENSLNAFLVERLSVPKGGTTISLPDGSMHAKADSGYQITVDSLAYKDTIHYGQCTRAYGFSAQGQLPGDSLTLNLNWKPEQEAFQDSAGSVKPLSLVPDLNGKIKISLNSGDVGKTYFLGIKYNILAGSLYNGNIDGGVILANFKSSKPAKAKFVDIASTIRDFGWTNQDSAFKSSLFLTGKEFKPNGAVPVQPWDMTWPVPGATNRTKVEAWWSDGVAWKQIKDSSVGYQTPVSNNFQIRHVPETARYIVAVERLLAPETYLKDSVAFTANTLNVSVSYKGDSLNRAIDQYCVETKYVDQYGKSDPAKCDRKPVGTPSAITVFPEYPYVYRIQYFSGGIRYGSPAYQVLTGPSWDRTIVLPQAVSLKQENYWHLIGFPFKGALNKSIVKTDTGQVAKGILDTIVVMHIDRAKGKPPLDTLEGWKNISFNAGEAFLVGGTRSFNLKMDPLNQFLPLQSVKMPLDSGWHFLANPFPTTLNKKQIRSAKRSSLRFWNLLPPPTAASQNYSWDTTNTLKAFSGYAHYSPSKDTLTFDLLADTVNTKPLPKNSGGPSLVKVALNSAAASSYMYLSAQPGDQNIPILPLPGAEIQMRLGGGSGYLLKSVSDFQALDEQLEILSQQDKVASLSLGLSAQASEESQIGYRLIDLESGQVFSEAELGEMPIYKGDHHYRLLIGNADFVQGRINNFLAEAPQSIALSQNFPNPAHGLTRILLSWPVYRGLVKDASLQILDTRGKELRKIPVGNFKVGRSEILLDFSNWDPGIYLYRFNVTLEGRTMHLQKRILVAP